MMKAVLSLLTLCIPLFAVAGDSVFPSDLPANWNSWSTQQISCALTETTTRETLVYRGSSHERGIVIVTHTTSSGTKNAPFMVVHKQQSASGLMHNAYYSDNGVWRKFNMLSAPSADELQLAERVFKAAGVPQTPPAGCH